MLGTGYGDCKVKKAASKDYRHKGGVIIDSEILIDAPEDVFALADEFSITDLLDKITAVFFSHSHEGHFSLSAIEELKKHRTLNVFGSRELLSLIPDDIGIVKNEAIPFQTIEYSGYTVIPIPANHKTDNREECCLNYVISKDRTVLYMLDGGFINVAAWDVISQTKLDAVIMDTAAELEAPTAKLISHGSFETNRIIKDMLVNSGAANERTRFILSHIPSKRKRSVHEELSALSLNHGFTVAYDGYFLNL